ncbi:MAG: SET domain-containing protein [Geminicoccaceae bacterium]
MSVWPEAFAASDPRRYLSMLAACPYLFVGDAGRCGLGVFTVRPIRTGAVIVVDEDGTLRQRAMTLTDALAQGWDRRHDLFQLDHDLFLPPRGCFDDLFNHSCEPSGGWRVTGAGARFVAIRDIGAGGELTYDYSCHLLGDETLACACEAPSCRGTVGPFASLPEPLRRRYRRLRVISPALLRRRS